MLDKKGMWTWNTFLYFILFYMPMTVIVFIVLLNAPEDILETRRYAGSLDDSFIISRVYDRVSLTDWNTGRLMPGKVADLSFLNKTSAKSLFYFHKDRPVAIKLSVGSKESVINPLFYNISRPLAPIRYNLITASKEIFIMKNNEVNRLDIELISSKRQV